MTSKKLSFEQAFERLEEIAEILENEAPTLEDTMRLFEEANELNKMCADMLDKAESKLKILFKEKDEFKLELE